MSEKIPNTPVDTSFVAATIVSVEDQIEGTHFSMVFPGYVDEKEAKRRALIYFRTRGYSNDAIEMMRDFVRSEYRLQIPSVEIVAMMAPPGVDEEDVISSLRKEKSEALNAALAYRRMARAFAKKLNFNDDSLWNRASGQTTCDQCGLEYQDHPQVGFITITCDSRLWKL